MSNPILMFLAAEKDATEVVNKARQRRTERLRQARLEVQHELDAYKAACENKNKKQEEQIKAEIAKVEQDTDESLKAKMEINSCAVLANKEQAHQVLLSNVCDIKCELHSNYNVHEGLQEFLLRMHAHHRSQTRSPPPVAN